MDFEKFFEFFEFKRVQPGPAHSARWLARASLGLPNRSKIAPKIDPNFDVILVSFLVPLGSLLASLLALLAAQIGPSSD